MSDTKKEEQLFEMEPQGSDMDAKICSGESLVMNALAVAEQVTNHIETFAEIAFMSKKMAEYLRGGEVSPRAMHYIAAHIDICTAHLAFVIDRLKEAEDALAGRQKDDKTA